MNERLKAYLAARDYEQIADGAVRWIREWFAANGSASPAVIGISGGKDSSTVAALCSEALGRERVLGVLMPNGMQPDIDVSRKLVETLGIRSVEVNIEGAYRAAREAVTGAEIVPGGGKLAFSRQAQINLGPRLRMTTLYAVSQCVNGRVSNNSNRSECYVGYSTRYGDSAGDFSPLMNLTVTEVRLIGRILGLPAEFVDKAPSDGLSGRTDEDALGFSYETLDTWILTGRCDDAQALEKIERRHRGNLFKLQPMPAYVLP